MLANLSWLRSGSRLSVLSLPSGNAIGEAVVRLITLTTIVKVSAPIAVVMTVVIAIAITLADAIELNLPLGPRWC